MIRLRENCWTSGSETLGRSSVPAIGGDGNAERSSNRRHGGPPRCQTKLGTRSSRLRLRASIIAVVVALGVLAEIYVSGAAAAPTLAPTHTASHTPTRTATRTASHTPIRTATRTATPRRIRSSLAQIHCSLRPTPWRSVRVEKSTSTIAWGASRPPFLSIPLEGVAMRRPSPLSADQIQGST